jgi:hypothetical protein
MTNYERIKNMTIEELASELYMNFISNCDQCPCDRLNYKECYTSGYTCAEIIQKWLNVE